jgi:hypothetical protein
MRHGSVSEWEVCVRNVVVLLRVHEVERENGSREYVCCLDDAIVVVKSDKEDDITYG